MEFMAQDLLVDRKSKTKEAKMSNQVMKQTSEDYSSSLSNTIELGSSFVKSAQVTLSDLDRSILELSALVEGLKKQSEKLAI